MKLRNLKLLLLPATITLNLALCGSSAAAAPAVGPGESMDVATGTQITQIEGFDWGPGVTKTIMALDRTVNADSVSADKFSVIERKENFDFAGFADVLDKGPATHTNQETTRQIVSAYTCDSNGNPINESSSYIALELKCSPSEGSPFCYSVLTSQNSWCRFYQLDVSLNDGCTLTETTGAVLKGLSVESSIDWNQSLFPDLAGIDLTGGYVSSDGDAFTYASYVPANASETNKRPLVIWLHGAGEGGTDTRINLLGNKVSALTAQEFQSKMGGAYILAPQIPDFWMTYNQEGAWSDNPGTNSVHLYGLKELIDSYVASNPGIDTNRIIIGGCSNGGYMTMNMIMNFPEYFAAAFPICEAYLDYGISYDQLIRIKDLPIWFVYASNDTTVDPTAYAEPTIARLKTVSNNVHTSIFFVFHDTTGLYTNEDGTPYQYAGHWSWLYFFNNQCSDNGVNMWDWLAVQSK